MVLDLTFDLKGRGNTEANVKSTTVDEHGVKMFRCGESAPANSIIGKNDQALTAQSINALQPLSRSGQERTSRAHAPMSALPLIDQVEGSALGQFQTCNSCFCAATASWLLNLSPEPAPIQALTGSA